MTLTSKSPVQSESPFDRLGARVLGDVRSRLWPLSRGAHVWQVTHLTLGDWRRWREVCDANAVADPLDLAGVTLALNTGAPAPAPFYFDGINGADTPQVVDLASSEQLGVGPELVEASPALRGVCVLVVEDVTFDTFTLALRAPDTDTAGPPVALALVDFEGVTSDTTGVVERTLYAATGEALVVRFTLDAWFVVWLAREWPLQVASSGEAARASLVIPESTALDALLLVT